MSITELLLAIGDDNVRFQPLDQCAIQLDWSAKKGGKITFGTDQRIIPGEGTEQMGLVLWLDRDLVASAIAASTAHPQKDASDGK